MASTSNEANKHRNKHLRTQSGERVTVPDSIVMDGRASNTEDTGCELKLQYEKCMLPHHDSVEVRFVI